jgi:hypothetical protein
MFFDIGCDASYFENLGISCIIHVTRISACGMLALGFLGL